MKFYALICVFVVNLCFSQQGSYIAHFNKIGQYTNPALTGNSSKIDLSIFSVQNWLNTGFKHHTNGISIESKLNQERIGVGLIVLSDLILLQKNNNILLNASYKINAFKGFLNFGLGLGLLNSSFDQSSLYINDLSDEYLTQLHTSNATDINFGLNYQKKNTNLGISIKHLNKPKYYYAYAFANNKSLRNYNLTFSHLSELSPTVDLRHDAWASFSSPKAWFISYLPKIQIKNDIILGVGYKSTSYVLLNIGLRLSRINESLDNFYFSYCFQQPLGKIGAITKQNHELCIYGTFEAPKRLKKIKNTKKEVSPLDF